MPDRPATQRIEFHVGLRCTFSFAPSPTGHAHHTEVTFEDRKIDGLLGFTFAAGVGVETGGLAEVVLDRRRGREPPADFVRYLLQQGVRVLLRGARGDEEAVDQPAAKVVPLRRCPEQDSLLPWEDVDGGPPKAS